MNGIQILIPLFGILMTIIVPLASFFMIVKIVRNENEVKKKMIENGMNPKDNSNRGTPTPGALKLGGLLIGAGLGLVISSILTNTLNINDEVGIYFGLIAVLGGAGLVITHNYARKQYNEDQRNRLDY